MVEQASIKLLRTLQEKGYTKLISKRYAGQETSVYFPEKGNPNTIAESMYSMPLQEDQALSITDALRWLTDKELKELCVITLA